MAISTQDIVRAKRRFFNAPTLTAPNSQLAVAFFSWLAQQGGTPDLQVVEFGPLSSSEVVIADAACKIYAIVQKCPTATATYTKGTDNATTASDAASEYRQKIEGINRSMAAFYPTGFPMANGFTMQGTTTADGGTGSSTNGASGVVLLGAP
jgi:hypothetical protein